MPRKRARDDAELDLSLFQEEKQVDIDLLQRIRNTWHFANFYQYVYIFGEAVKLSNFDIDDFEGWCLDADKHDKLAEIGLALLKYVSSHRGLNADLFDEYTRRQFTAKAPQRNPYGEEEEPKKFAYFDIFTKLKVLQQLSVWTLGNADRIRGLMGNIDNDQLLWRIEPFGYDSHDRDYFVLDDSRLYRRTAMPLPPTPTKPKAKPKPKSKPKAKAKPRTKPTRASKRIKLSTPEPESEEDEQEDVTMTNGDEDATPAENSLSVGDEDFGGMKWECIAVSMGEYQDFLESIRRSRDPNEKALHKRITDVVMPELEKKEESRQRKILKQLREQENEQKLATAKRSSRIAGRKEKEREEEETRLAEERKRQELEMAHKAQAKQQKLEEARESRMQTREQRLQEREVKRILHEEELAKLEARKAKGEDDEARHSSRHIQNEMERRQKELEELKEEEDKWIFDCAGCGLYGENIDDGTHSIACDRCNIWQHSKCHGIEEADAEREDFSFICSDCKRKEEDAKKPRIPPLKLGRIGTSSSPQTDQSVHRTADGDTNRDGSPNTGRIVEGVSMMRAMPSTASDPRAAQPGPLQNGPSLSPHGQHPGPPGYHRQGPPQVGIPQPVWDGTALPPPPPQAGSGQYNAQDGTPTPRLPASLYQVHQQAHSNALANASHHPPPSAHLNGHAMPQAPMFPPSQQQQQYRQPLPQSSYMSTFNQRPASSPSNGVTPSPVKKQATPSPTAPRHVDGNNPYTGPRPAAQSPYHQLSPPPNSAAHQRLAGQSPTKQPSPSPPPPYRYQAPLQSSPAMPPPVYALQSSPSIPPPAATPSAQMAQSAASPAVSILHASPQAASSPIPPVGDGPVIPQKHDAMRPPSRDHVAETPAFPPSTALSPSRTQDGKGMGTQAGEGGLGTGTVPVKKIPESPVLQAAQPAPAVVSASPVAQARGAGGEDGPNGHI